VAEPEPCSQLARGAVGPLPCSAGDAGAGWWGALSGAAFASAPSRSLVDAAELRVQLRAFSCAAWHTLRLGFAGNPRWELCPIPVPASQLLGKSRSGESLWWLCCPGGADLMKVCKTTTGLSSCKLVWLCSEEQSEAKELRVPCSGFSRSPRLARG